MNSAGNRTFNVAKALRQAQTVLYLQTEPGTYRLVKRNEITPEGVLPEGTKVGRLYIDNSGIRRKRLFLNVKAKTVYATVTVYNMLSGVTTNYRIPKEEIGA